MEFMPEAEFRKLPTLEQMSYFYKTILPENYHFYPIIPLINVYDNDSDTKLGFIVKGVAEASGKWTVFIANAIIARLDPLIVKNCLQAHFDSLKELDEAGWRVD